VKVIVIEEFGSPGRMSLVERPEPVAAAGQVVLRTEAVGVGGVDAVIRRGTIGLATEPGMVPGSEVAGTVVALGDGVDPSWLGRRVWAFTGISGGYAELAVAGVADLTPLPDALSAIDAVALGSAATVAHFALEHGRLAPGESLLVRGGAGSIGIAAIELATRAGAGVVAATTSSAERGRRLREHGATHVLDRAGDGEGMPETVDVILDVVGGPDVPAFVDRLGPNGRYVLVGAIAGFPRPDFGQALLRSFGLSRSFAAFSLDSVPVDRRNRVREELLQAAARGELHAMVDDVLPLADAAEAHRRMDDGTVFGRIVLTP
jgi:NADPH2:quinone reductase